LGRLGDLKKRISLSEKKPLLARILELWKNHVGKNFGRKAINDKSGILSILFFFLKFNKIHDSKVETCKIIAKMSKLLRKKEIFIVYDNEPWFSLTDFIDEFPIS
jgi:hypothetical protein